jgi:2-iminoacetate synthase ThiH
MAGAEWGIRMEPSQFQEAIRAIGRVPVERTTTYGRVQRNTFSTSRIVDPAERAAFVRA